MNNKPQSPAKTSSRANGQLRGFIAPLVGAVLMGLTAYQAHNHWADIIEKVAELGFAGYLLFVGAWVVLASACFPVSVFGVSAGALFGLPLGVAIIFTASMLAASVMFGLARGVLRGPVASFIAARPKLAAIDRLAGEKALRFNFLTRLSPLNFGLACYTLASGRTSLRTYLAGNLATLPSMFLQVWLGTLAVGARDDLNDGAGFSRNIWLGASGLLIALVLVWQITRLVRQALAEVAEETAVEKNEI